MTATSTKYADPKERFDRAEEALRAVVDDHIAALYRPIDYSRRGNEIIAYALVVAKPDEPNAMAWWASDNGDPERVKTFPKRIIRVIHRECGGQFMLVTMKGYVAIERHLSQGTIPVLAKSVKWTDEQRAGWKVIQQKITGLREHLRPRVRRKSRWTHTISPRGAA